MRRRDLVRSHGEGVAHGPSRIHRHPWRLSCHPPRHPQAGRDPCLNLSRPGFHAEYVRQRLLCPVVGCVFARRKPSFRSLASARNPQFMDIRSDKMTRWAGTLLVCRRVYGVRARPVGRPGLTTSFRVTSARSGESDFQPIMVRTTGLEPVLPYGRQILSLLRLPISPRPQSFCSRVKRYPARGHRASTGRRLTSLTHKYRGLRQRAPIRPRLREARSGDAAAVRESVAQECRTPRASGAIVRPRRSPPTGKAWCRR